MSKKPSNLGFSFDHRDSVPTAGHLSVKTGNAWIPVITGYRIEKIIEDVKQAMHRLASSDHTEFIPLGADKRYELQITKCGTEATFALVCYSKSLLDPIDGKMRCHVFAELPFEKLAGRLVKAIARFEQDPNRKST